MSFDFREMPLPRLLAVIFAFLIGWAVVALTVPYPAEASDTPLFSVKGMGGGGGLYTPSISPYDRDFILVCCDMGGVYRSLDGGRTWELIHWSQGLISMQYAPPPVFLRGRIYWVTERKRICFSDDQGKSWITLPAGPWEKQPSEMKGKNFVQAFTVLPGSDETVLVSASQGVWLGKGRTWKRLSARAGGAVCLMEDIVFSAQGDDGGLSYSSDGGTTWQPTRSLPGRIVALAAARDSGRNSLLIVSVENKGLFRSEDMGATWAACKTPFENEGVVAIPPGQSTLAYALQTGSGKTRQLLQSRDGGKSWQKVFHMPPPGQGKGSGHNVEPSWLQTQLHWGYYFTRKGLGVSPGNPDFCLVATQGEVYASRDSAASWTQLMAKEVPPLDNERQRWESIGLEVTSCWGYHFDPHDPQREYIAYTDIGFARSLDKGKSWSWSAKGSPWRNTFYDLAFDPAAPGRIYAAASNRHDIPHYTNVSATFPGSRIHYGGVVASNNWGETWATPYKRNEPGALPRQVCTTIALDPASPPGRRTLFAGIFGENDEAGVYISTDSGKTWKQTDAQPGIFPNRHVYRLRIHPKTGDLYCLITGLRAASPNFFNPAGGGIWVSADQGKSWKHLSAGSQLNRWATAFGFDPANDKGLYVTAATPPGSTAGGVYKTVNGGETWLHVLKDKEVQRQAGGGGYDHHMAVAVHLEDPQLVFAGTSLHGLFFSRDGGKIWRWCRDFPFSNVQSITFDPRNPDALIVTTFGAGVWSASVKAIIRKY